MANQYFVNNVTVYAAQLIGSGDTSIVLDDVSSLPNVADGDFFLLTFFRETNNIESLWEIVKCTAIDYETNTLTVERGQEGTSARAWSIGSKAQMRATAGTFSKLRDDMPDPVDLTAVNERIDTQNGLAINGVINPVAQVVDIPKVETDNPALDTPLNAQAQAVADRFAYLAGDDGALLVGGAEQSYTTVAFMTADTKLNVGDRVRWSGYYNVFDGGGNRGVVVAAGTGVADGGVYFNLANGLQVFADMSDGIYVDRWGPVNPNADVAFAKAIAYAVSNPSSSAFGCEVICGPAAYYETSLPLVFTANPLVGVTLNLNRSTIKKVTSTTSGLPSRLARGGSVTDVMNVDAVIIYDHQDNSYYVRGGIRGDGYIQSALGNGIFAPRCYLMNFDEVTIDASNGDFGWKTHDTFMCKFHSFQSIGAKRPIWWANDGSNAATGTTCHFSRVWALAAKVQAWDMYGLLYSSYDCIAADNITAVGAQGAYRFELCNGAISGIGAENTNVVDTIRIIGGQLTIDGITTFSPTVSSAWLRATDSARVTFSGARSDNLGGTISVGAISAETGARIIYDGTGPANGARKRDSTSRLLNESELTGYIAEIHFTVSGGVLTTTKSDGCTITRAQAGVYPLVFSTALADANYRVEVELESSGTTLVVPGYSSKAVGGCNITSRDFAGTAADCVSGSVKIFR